MAIGHEDFVMWPFRDGLVRMEAVHGKLQLDITIRESLREELLPLHLAAEHPPLHVRHRNRVSAIRIPFLLSMEMASGQQLVALNCSNGLA